MKNIFTCLIGLLALNAFAAPGDTTSVIAHQKTDMTWYGSYNAWAVFPAPGKTYHKILLKYTMGCATGGCSDWDYTTRIRLMIPSGIMDSTVASIDTISTNPLVTDTTWNVFEVEEPFELARVITPYGGSLPNNWEHDFIFDITDYSSLLHDSVKVQAFYSGWSSGFSATTEFIFVEGTPARPALSVENVYNGYKDYINSASFESQFLNTKTVSVLPAAQGAMVRVIPTGHGFVNALNCAEFCEKDYYLKVNNQQIATQAMWRNDCGLNPIWPQAGTWLYDRANWCPGDKAFHYDHDLTSFVSSNNSLSINIDVEPYVYSVPAGETPAGYYFTTQYFQFGAFSFAHDVELADILAPSKTDEYARMNPVCGKVILKIKNNGSQNLTSCDIRYGIEGGNTLNYTWSGNLAPMESEIVSIEIPDPVDWETYTGSLHFLASVDNPNGQADEYALNNSKKAAFTAPPVYPAQLKFLLRTNTASHETFWSLKSADGTVLKSVSPLSLSPSTNYIDTFNLSPGCYELLIGDTDKDGLAFFGNNDGSGSASLRNNGGSFFNQTFTGNFGTEIRHYFTVGLGIGSHEYALKDLIQLYPNPSENGKVNFSFYGADRTDLNCSLLDVNGGIVWQNIYEGESEFDKELDFSAFPKGVYILRFSNGTETHNKKLILN
ncbi:MAG: peptide-N-glycosidase F-related protein [Owenweeksia sp.]